MAPLSWTYLVSELGRVHWRIAIGFAKRSVATRVLPSVRDLISRRDSGAETSGSRSALQTEERRTVSIKAQNAAKNMRAPVTGRKRKARHA